VEAIGSNHPLRRFFTGLVEQAFCAEVGVCDPTLTDYLADVLVNFTHMERLNAIRIESGRRLEQIAMMLAMSADDKPASVADRDRAVYRNIGDYTLFWAGVYPEQLRRPRHRAGDVLLDYVSQGKRSYAIVAGLVDDHARPPSRLFRQLSEEFESCLYGLGLVRRELEETLLGGDAREIIL
jgi:hypothetical protein